MQLRQMACNDIREEPSIEVRSLKGSFRFSEGDLHNPKNQKLMNSSEALAKSK